MTGSSGVAPFLNPSAAAHYTHKVFPQFPLPGIAFAIRHPTIFIHRAMASDERDASFPTTHWTLVQIVKGHDKEKRGGAGALAPLDEAFADEHYRQEPADGLDPERLYDRAWATQLLNTVRGNLRASFVRKTGCRSTRSWSRISTGMTRPLRMTISPSASART